MGAAAFGPEGQPSQLRLLTLLHCQVPHPLLSSLLLLLLRWWCRAFLAEASSQVDGRKGPNLGWACLQGLMFGQHKGGCCVWVCVVRLQAVMLLQRHNNLYAAPGTSCSPLGLLLSAKLRLPVCRGAVADTGLAPAPPAAGFAGSKPRYSWRRYAASAASEVRLVPLHTCV